MCIQSGLNSRTKDDIDYRLQAILLSLAETFNVVPLQMDCVSVVHCKAL